MKKKMFAATASFLILALPFFMVVSPVVSAQDRLDSIDLTERPSIPHKITRGETRDLGGGTYIRIDFGERGTLVFLWGTRADRGPITVITRGMDILGHMILENGTKKPITSESVTLYRIDSLVEFEDANRNGIFDPSSTVSFVDQASGDRIIKAASLELAWSFRQREPVITREGIEWTFSLEARNVSYTRVARDAASMTAESVRPSTFVESIRFVFHLKAGLSAEKRMLADLRTEAVSSTVQRMEKEKAYELEKLNLTTKMDHIITGWDYAPDNTRASLMLKFGLHVGRTIDATLGRELLELIRSRFYGDTSISTSYSEGTQRPLWTEGSDDVLVKRMDTMGSGAVSMRNGQRELLRYFWDDEVGEVNDEGGRTMRSRAQFTNISLIGPLDPVWRNSFLKARTGIGATLSGHFVYPRADNIHHDPGIQVSGWSVKKPEARQSKGFWEEAGELILEERWPVVLIVLALVLLVVVAVASALSRRRFDQGDEELRREEEEEVFVVRSRKRDWDRLRPK
ncbi:MAG: hypothetical protein ACMUHU_00395 [Thermoplasmatota archaeon]